eukprot:1567400-Karenia_brevis.AAC.1
MDGIHDWGGFSGLWPDCYHTSPYLLLLYVVSLPCSIALMQCVNIEDKHVVRTGPLSYLHD